MNTKTGSAGASPSTGRAICPSSMLLPQARTDVALEEILASHGLKPGPEQMLDAAAGVTLVNWSS